MAVELTSRAKQPTDILVLCRTIAESSPVPTAEVDPVTKAITCVNLAFCLLTGKSKQALVGSPLSLIVPDGPECLALMDHVQETGDAAIHEGEISGSQPLRWTYTLWPVLVGQTQTLAIILQVTEATAAGQDAVLINQALLLGALRQHELIEAAEMLNIQLRAEMLARKTAEKALLRSERLAVAGRMAAVLAHEINNPLAGVMDLLYLVRTREDVPHQALQYIDQAEGELNRIAHITRQTLGFYRESSSSTTFGARALLESIVDLLRSRVQAKGAAIDLQCDQGLMVTATYGELRQVLSNFLLNSLDALQEEGRVAIRASLSSDPKTASRRIRFTLSDNGTGIEPSVLERIFEAFYTTKGAIGNGLGLWVCQQIIGHHNGSLRVRSSTHGHRKGTTFSITLPTHSETPELDALNSGMRREGRPFG